MCCRIVFSLCCNARDRCQDWVCRALHGFACVLILTFPDTTFCRYSSSTLHTSKVDNSSSKQILHYVDIHHEYLVSWMFSQNFINIQLFGWTCTAAVCACGNCCLCCYWPCKFVLLRFSSLPSVCVQITLLQYQDYLDSPKICKLVFNKAGYLHRVQGSGSIPNIFIWFQCESQFHNSATWRDATQLTSLSMYLSMKNGFNSLVQTCKFHNPVCSVIGISCFPHSTLLSRVFVLAVNFCRQTMMKRYSFGGWIRRTFYFGLQPACLLFSQGLRSAC